MVSGVYPSTRPSLGFLLIRAVATTLARAVENREERTAHVRTWFQSFVRNILILASFVLWTVAAFGYSAMAGLIVAGVSCSVLSWLMKGAPAPTTPRQAGPPRK